MPRKKRRTFTPTQKAEIVRRHLTGKEPVSALAEEFDLQPSQIHTWVNLVLSQAEHAFETQTKKNQDRTQTAKDRQIEQLQEKLNHKHEVISELMEVNILAKKVNGEL